MMPLADPLEILPLRKPLSPPRPIVVPGSKSISNRALVLSALAQGESRLSNLLVSDDSERMVEGLQGLGFRVQFDAVARSAEVQGQAGKVPSGRAEVFVGNAGTAARFLPPLAALGSGYFSFRAEARMSRRPMRELLAGLRRLGADVKGDSYPFELGASGLNGGDLEVDISGSSQVASGLLMAGPCMKKPLRLRVTGSREEMPYVQMTVELMKRFGVEVRRLGQVFEVPLSPYQARGFSVEADVSAACYFFAAAALLGGKVTVAGLSASSLQGDIKFLGLLKHMGCRFYEDPEGLTVEKEPGSKLQGLEVDMGSFSDQALTLAALAPFCEGPVTITHVGHIRRQECDRLEAMVFNLKTMGAQAEILPGGDGVRIQPSRLAELHGGMMETFQDHRVAMAFALPGLLVEGIKVRDPSCVAKTFPAYWDALEELRKV
jgi:3-phosphoshikimate 1-carboxyvinyltransferase